jgi:hypothetical protein
MPLFAEVLEDFEGWDWLALQVLLAVDYEGYRRIRMLNKECVQIHVSTRAVRQRLKLSLADHGWKARKRRFQTGRWFWA